MKFVIVSFAVVAIIVTIIAVVIAQSSIDKKQTEMDLSLFTNKTATPSKDNTPTPSPTPISPSNQAIVATSRGSFTINLAPEHAPKSVENFLNKVKDKFYDNLTFHRVEDWVVQGGDPKGDGTGGGDQPTEISDASFGRGSVGVARGGDIKISNDSQFFICTQDCNWLTNQYTYLGSVSEADMKIIEQIKKGDIINLIKTTEIDPTASPTPSDDPSATPSATPTVDPIP